MMRVLIFSTAYFPFVGGAEVAMKEITDRISPKDIEFVMITAKMKRGLPSKEVIGAITVHRIGIGIPMVDKLMLALCGDYIARRLHTITPFTLVWSLMASYNGFAAERFSSRFSLPFLLTLQEGDPIEYILHKVRWVLPWFRRIFTRATSLQAISTYLLDWGKRMGFCGAVGTVIPNGVDIARFTRQYSQEVLAETRTSFGFSAHAYVLITASRLVPKNGIEHVIRALPFLPDHVCFAICGVGELEPALRALTTSLHLDSRVAFLGNQAHDVLPRFFQAADAFIRPSLSEGLGNAFLEAMAAYIPVLATPVGGIPDFLIDGKTGFFCTPENPESIAMVVQRLMNLPEEQKKRICSEAKRLVEAQYTWDLIAQEMMLLLKQTEHALI